MRTLSPFLRPVRPRFRLATTLAADEVLARLDQALSVADCRFVGSVLDRHVELLVGREQRHFWSPWLSAEVHSEGDGAVVSGRFGPHPHLWSFFVALYAIWTFFAIGAAVFGYSQWTLDRPSTALWGLPCAAIVALAQYIGSIVGQRLGARQMDEVGRFVEDSTAVPPVTGVGFDGRAK